MSTGAQAVLSRHRFHVDEYHRMIEAGILTRNDRVELLDGEIVEMTPIGSRHVSCVGRLNRLLVMTLGERAFVSPQGAVTISDWSEPEPDIAVCRARPDDYATAVPATADTLLLVEVADTSLRKDRLAKLPLYAAAGVPEVWIVDLTADAIEVYREPDGSEYASREVVTTGTIAPVAFGDLELEVARILPVA